MLDEHEAVQSGQIGGMGTGVRVVSDMRGGDEDRRDMEAHNVYGKIGEEVIRSISKISSFESGYPRRIAVGKEEKRAATWQKFYDWQYEQICRIHGITPEPR